LRVGSAFSPLIFDITPDTLAPFGIKTIVLTESCGHMCRYGPTDWRCDASGQGGFLEAG